MDTINKGLRYCAFILLLLLTFTCSSQKILVFDRDAHARRIRFKISDDLAVKVNDRWIGGVTEDISDSTISIASEIIVVSKIDAIRFDSRSGSAGLLRAVAVTFPVAGVSLLAINAINSVINHDYHPVISQNALVTAAVLVASGPVAYFFTYHRYHINKHHRLKTIDLSIR